MMSNKEHAVVPLQVSVSIEWVLICFRTAQLMKGNW